MKNRYYAFTLIELILALALSVVVAGALASALFTVFHAKSTLEAAIEATQGPAMAADLVQHELENAVPPTGIISSSFGFEGTDNDVSFPISGTEPKAQDQGGMSQIEYCIVGDALVRRVTTNLLSDNVVTPPDQPLCHRVTAIQFQYYDGTNWNDSWDSTAQTNNLPVAMQFTLTLSPAKPGGDIRTTTRTVYFACYKPANQTSPVTSTQ